MKNVLLQLLAILSFWGLLANKSYGQEKLSEGEKLLNQAKALTAQQKFDSAILICEKALQVAEKEKQDSVNMEITYQMGACFFYKSTMESMQKAEVYFLKSQDVCKKISKQNTLIYTRILRGLINVYQFTNRYDQQLKISEERVNILGKIFDKEHQEYARGLSLLGVAYADNGMHKKAELTLLKALPILKNKLGDTSKEYALAKYYLAICYYYQNQFTISEILFKELAEKQYFARDTYSGLGQLYNTLGNYEQAIKWLLKSIEIDTDQESIYYANSFANLAAIYHKNKDYKNSKKNYNKALELLKVSATENHEYYANAMGGLANLYFDYGYFKKSKELYEKTLQIIGVLNLNNNYLYEAEHLNNLLILYIQFGLLAEAETLLNKNNKKFANSSLYQKDIDIVYSNTFLYEVQNQIKSNQIKSNQIKSNQIKSNQIYNELLEIINFQIQNNFPALSEDERLNYYKTVKNYLASYQSFALRVHQQKNLSKFPQKSLDSLKANLLELQLATKGILLQSSQKMKTNILNSQDSSLIKLFGQWEKQKQQVMEYEKLSVADKAKNKINIDSLAEATNSIEKQLSAKSENFASITDKRKYTWQDIQKALKPNEVAVEMVRISKFGVEKVLTDSSDTEYFKAKGFYPKYERYGLTDTTYYAALLISKNTKDAPELVVLENGNDLEDKHIKNYLKNITSPKNTDTDNVSYAAFWQKIAQSATLTNLKGENKKIFVSLDGTYHKLNLGTLYNPATKKYLADEFAIQQLTNLKEIITTQNKAITPTKDMLLLGFPNYDLDKTKRWEEAEKQRLERANKKQPAVAQVESFGIVGEDKDQKRAGIKNLDSLPNTREEVLEVEKIAQAKNYQAYTYLRNAALEETVKAANNPRVLHIATHGFFNEAAGNPLLNSGLYLTGANQTKSGKETMTVDDIFSGKKAEDGILTSQEAMNLNLDKTDLVVLSACQTGLGEVSNGEGVYGLQRAFIVAGSKAVLCSLWEVDDVVSFEFMKLFYENYLVSSDKHKALKATQQQVQKIKSKYAHPYYWGSFVLIGN